MRAVKKRTSGEFWIGDNVFEKIRDHKLTLSAVQLYMYLAASDGLTASLETSKNAVLLNVSERTIRRAAASLVRAGLYLPPGIAVEEVVDFRLRDLTALVA